VQARGSIMRERIIVGFDCGREFESLIIALAANWCHAPIIRSRPLQVQLPTDPVILLVCL
jgi:hypothetical protein